MNDIRFSIACFDRQRVEVHVHFYFSSESISTTLLIKGQQQCLERHRSALLWTSKIKIAFDHKGSTLLWPSLQGVSSALNVKDQISTALDVKDQNCFRPQGVNIALTVITRSQQCFECQRSTLLWTSRGSGLLFWAPRSVRSKIT